MQVGNKGHEDAEQDNAHGALLNTEVYKEPGCAPCEYDFDWVFRFPSTLMWVDKIVVTPSIMAVVQDELWPTGEHSCFARILRMYFDLLDSHGLLEVQKPDADSLSPLLRIVEAQCTVDRERLGGIPRSG